MGEMIRLPIMEDLFAAYPKEAGERMYVTHRNLPANTFESQTRAHERHPAGRVLMIIYQSNDTIPLVWRNGSYPGWALPGGKVENDDPTYAAAGIREASEELGLQVDDSTICLAALEIRYFFSPTGQMLPPLPIVTLEAHAPADEEARQTAIADAEQLSVANFSPTDLPEQMIFDDRRHIVQSLGRRGLVPVLQTS